MNTFTIVLLSIIIIGIAFFVLKRARERDRRADFLDNVLRIKPEVERSLESIEKLFAPNIKTSKEDIDNFIRSNQNTLKVVDELYHGKRVYYDILKAEGFEEFRIQVSERYLTERQKRHNRICLEADVVNKQAEEIISEFYKLTASNHYFTDSELKQFQLNFSDFSNKANPLLTESPNYINKEQVERAKVISNEIETDREQHNKDFVANELQKNCKYFDTVLGQYPLDPQQRESIVKLEDNCLVIASAGSGKTSTILGKAKYLVEKQGIEPSKILLITYTKKAATELQERMKIDGMTCCTFHKLAKDIIARVTGQTPSFCDADISLNIFHNLIETNDNFLHDIDCYILSQMSLMGLEHDYTDAFTYFEDRRKYGIQALFPDRDGKIIFTKSEEEKRLVSILTRFGVPFRYEEPYIHPTVTNERRQYRPDFTIYYLNRSGQWERIFLEHFGIDFLGNVPNWFGEGTRGGWGYANQRYNEGIQWKRSIHQRYGTILIETTSADFMDGTVETKLINQLRQHGVPIKERTDEELYNLLVERSRKLEKAVLTLIVSFITLMKANEKTIDELIESINQRISLSALDIRNKSILTHIIKPFYEEYERRLRIRHEIDFTDAIIQATELCRRGLWRKYDYILVDEFQDISVDRYKFLQALRSNYPKAKLFCVGDDWQSIFRFAGSDMSLVYEFEKYFGYTEQCKIETTYRFHQPLIDKSSEFIMKNKEQKEKSIKTPNGDNAKTFLNFVKCDGDDENGVKKEVLKIVSDIPAHQSIMLLGRYNYDAFSVGYKGDIDMKDKRMMVNIGKRKIPFLSVHSAKGLEADHVILVNCNQGAYGFPSLIEDDPILDFVLSKSETYPYAEERRLFYVAMTRAKLNMFVLYDKKKPSPFIGEFLLRIERGSYLCPRCLEGKLEAIKEGNTINGERYRSFVCSNKESACNFFETVYGDLTPPGILITEGMTVQDIEQLREARRVARPLALNNPIRGFQAYSAAAPSPPEIEPQEGRADDLPF